MGEEIIFKTSPFGFHKEDVLNYISGQKEKEAKLIAQLDELKAAARQSQTSVSESSMEFLNLSNRMSAIEQEKQLIEQENRLLAEELELAKRAFSEKEAETRALAEQLQAVITEKENEKAAHAPAAQPGPAAPPSAPVSSPDVPSLQAEAEKLRSLESQLGSAIIDARRYSDRLVNEAKAKSAKISGEVYLAINETTGKVNSLTEDMSAFKADFDETLRLLQIKLESLAKNLNGAAADMVGHLEKNSSEPEL
ncbi:MAG: hypothetical protein LBS36_03210 [Oscillospiraceae bacterium]|jgi:DNA repair exonuclease SbcCD ATPase subunit|nr:hypothetical protein [Oscillospiraceae bacterium]